MEHRNYKEYSLQELYEALDTVDQVKHPGQMEAIERRIEEIEGNAHEAKEPVMIVSIGDLPKSLRLALGLAILHWILFVSWFSYALIMDSIGYNWGMHILIFIVAIKAINKIEIKSFWMLFLYSIGLPLLWSQNLFNVLNETGYAYDPIAISLFISSICSLFLIGTIVAFNYNFYKSGGNA